MKRIFAFALILVLCLGLAACVSENKYADLEEMLDEGRYSEAMTYILSLQAQNSSSVPLFIGQIGDGTYSDEDLNSDTEPSAEVLALIEELMGEWVITKETEDQPQKIVFRQDNTCIVDGAEMTWKREATSLTEYPTRSNFLSIWEGETQHYTVTQPVKSDAGELTFTVVVVDRITTSYLATNKYFNPERYEIIELTMDNWQEYFGWTEEMYYNTNAFGDVTTLGTSYRLTLKKEYYNRLSSIKESTGAVEISYSTANYTVNISSDGKTYSKGYLADVGANGGTHTWATELEKSIHGNADRNYFGAWYCTENTWENNYSEMRGPFCEYVESKSVLRIQGTLYLVKPQ